MSTSVSFYHPLIVMYSSIKRLSFLAFAIALFAGSTSLAQPRTTSGTAALDADGTVMIDNHEGSITVDTWDRAEVKYEAVVQPEDGAEHPEATTVRVTEDQNRFTIRTEYDETKADGDGWSWFGGGGQNVMPVAYTLTVPRSAALEVDDHESEMQITNLSGDLGVETHEGSITVRNQSGGAMLTSHDGPITVEDHSGSLDIETHDSHIRLRSIGGDVEIDTHDGKIEAAELRGGLEVETHDGSGEFAFTTLTEDVEVDTHSGDFTFIFPENAFDLRTDFHDTRLTADFDLSAYRMSDDDDADYRGQVNGGGPRLSLSAHSGSFDLRTQ